MSFKYILFVIILIVAGGVMVYKNWWSGIEKPGTSTMTEVGSVQCSDSYTVDCYQESERIKEGISCLKDDDCSFKKMESYCSPGFPNYLKCINAKYYCGSDGYCKGCDCPPQ